MDLRRLEQTSVGTWAVKSGASQKPLNRHEWTTRRERGWFTFKRLLIHLFVQQKSCSPCLGIPERSSAWMWVWWAIGRSTGPRDAIRDAVREVEPQSQGWRNSFEKVQIKNLSGLYKLINLVYLFEFLSNFHSKFINVVQRYN